MAMFHSRKKLLRAVKDGDEALVREYLGNSERRAEWLGALGDSDITALHTATENRRLSIMQLLIDAGADVNARTRSGRTPLMLAAKHSTADAALLLADNHADLHAKDNDGMSPLGHAVYHQKPDVAANLLARGVNPEDGFCFMRACSNRDVKMIALLIAHGADTKVVYGSYHQHPVHILAQHGCVEGFNLIAAANGIADIDARQSNDGNTALHLAALGGHVGMVEALLKAGASTQLDNNEGLTAEAAAMKRDKQQTARVIRGYSDEQKAPASAPARLVANDNGDDEVWLRIGAHTVAQIQTIARLHRRITHVFNFESRERTVISENLNTGAETTLPPQDFDVVSSAAIEAARSALQKLGGEEQTRLPGKPVLKAQSTPK